MSRRRTGGAGTSAEDAPGGRHFGRPGRWRALQIIAITLSAVLVAGIGFTAVQVLRLQSNVTTEPLNLSGGQGTALPVDLSRDPVQILVLGTDRRETTGHDEPNNSDVMMLLTMSADRENVTVVSFPRDMLVSIPSCTDPQTGEVYPAQELAQLNGALSYGGPGCTVAAINELTGLHIDHFMMADFEAVEELSNTLGGVEVCVTQAVRDEDSGLDIPAGVSEVQGEQALAFLRTRKGFGDGGDQGRIQAQQSFLASLARKVKEEGTLSNIPKMYAIAETVTNNLTVDEGLNSVPQLLMLADRLRSVDLENIAFVTVPTVPYELDPNRLVLDTENAIPLFDALIEDRSITGGDETDASPAPGVSGSSNADATETAHEPSAFVAANVPVTVLNGSGINGRGAQIGDILRGEGFVQTLTEPAATAPLMATQIFFGPGYEEAALQIAELFGISDPQVIPSGATNGVAVSIGSDFAAGTEVDTGSLDGGLTGQTAQEVTCQPAFGF